MAWQAEQPARTGHRRIELLPDVEVATIDGDDHMLPAKPKCTGAADRALGAAGLERRLIFRLPVRAPCLGANLVGRPIIGRPRTVDSGSIA